MSMSIARNAPEGQGAGECNPCVLSVQQGVDVLSDPPIPHAQHPAEPEPGEQTLLRNRKRKDREGCARDQPTRQRVTKDLHKLCGQEHRKGEKVEKGREGQFQ